MMGWVIARVEGRKMSEVCERVDGYFPVTERWTKPTGKRQPVKSKVPLFPGWAFICDEHYPGLLLIPGVKGVVRYGKSVMILDDNDISRIREIEIEQMEKPVEDSAERFSVGDLVQVIALNGIFGVITDMVGDSLARVDVDGRMKITVSCCFLSKRGL